ncbi:glycosyltransferase [Candidatus Woesearchaeota archaeon]|nr:glycosyltransferase [Candidatus Woesearchaeota archaeon]
MKTTIIIPVLNHEESLEDVLRKTKGLANETLIVCDITKTESRTEIKRWLESLKKRYALKVLYRENERGYGSAVKFGLDRASGGISVVMTGDNSDEPATVSKMIRLIEEGADVVCGTRFSRGGHIIGNIFKERIARAISLAMRVLSRTNTFDATNGFRAYRTAVARKIKTEEKSFAFNIEILVKIAEKGYKIAETMATWRNRESGKPNFQVRKEGREYARWTAYAVIRMPSRTHKIIASLILLTLLWIGLTGI